MYNDFDNRVNEAIPAEIRMISGCHDSQTSADVFDTSSFRLPKTCGKAGGACTAALLKVLYKHHEQYGSSNGYSMPQANYGGEQATSWVEVLRKMRTVLLDMGYDQVPQLTSSRLIDLNEPFSIVNKSNPQYGARRAVLIGICYRGQDGELTGCHNDVYQIKNYLTQVQGFHEQNMTILMDDGRHGDPTYSNILNAFRHIAAVSMPGDTVFIHYSGHGGRVRDTTGDEDDGYDETLIPVDYRTSGQITDDLLYQVLVKQLRNGVVMTCLMDCCHSGTVLDLPYRFTADGDVTEGMVRNDKFDFDLLLAAGLIGCCCCGPDIFSLFGGLFDD